MKFKINKNEHTVDLIFTLALFCVFTASALIVTFIGANVYKQTINTMNDNFNVDTAVSYITTKLQQSDVKNGVSVASIGTTPAIMLSNKYDDSDVEFVTYIYCYQDNLYELFTKKDMPVTPDMGTKIIPVNSLNFEIQDNGNVKFKITDENNSSYTKTVNLKCL